MRKAWLHEGNQHTPELGKPDVPKGKSMFHRRLSIASRFSPKHHRQASSMASEDSRRHTLSYELTSSSATSIELSSRNATPTYELTNRSTASYEPILNAAEPADDGGPGEQDDRASQASVAPPPEAWQWPPQTLQRGLLESLGAWAWDILLTLAPVCFFGTFWKRPLRFNLSDRYFSTHSGRHTSRRRATIPLRSECYATHSLEPDCVSDSVCLLNKSLLQKPYSLASGV